MPDAAPFRRGFRRLTCPVIITRHGGLDGVALQKEEYHELLNDLGIFIHVVAGREETRFGPISLLGRQRRTVIPRLDLSHPDSRRLYAGAFRHGPEARGAEALSDEAWMALFLQHKRHIRTAVDQELRKIPDDTPVFVYNLLSLRYLHPAAAVRSGSWWKATPGGPLWTTRPIPTANAPSGSPGSKASCAPSYRPAPRESHTRAAPIATPTCFTSCSTPTSRRPL